MENWDREKAAEEAIKDVGVDDVVSLSSISGEDVSGRKASRDRDDGSASPPEGRRRSSVVEWKTPLDTLEAAKLSLGVDPTEIAVYVQDVRDKDHSLLERDCCAADVIKVWEFISKFIIQKLKDGSGVQIPGLCTISYQIDKIDVPEAPEYFELLKIPVMVLSPQVIKMYNLRNAIDDCPPNRIKSVPLNLTWVALRAKLPRHTVEGVVTELLQAFARAVVCNKKIEFPFPNIGKLQVQNQMATMQFYEQFYKKLGLNLPESYLDQRYSRASWISSISTNEVSGDDLIIPGQMTPLRQHIPGETFRSVFHLGEVRSVHDTDLLVDPADLEFGKKCERNREEKELLNIKLKIKEAEDEEEGQGEDKPEQLENQPQPQQNRPRLNSDVCELENNFPTEALKHDYTWNSTGKYWEDECGEPIIYVAEPLYTVKPTGKYIIDVLNSSKQILLDALFTHHHNVTSRILGNAAVKKHYERRGRLAPNPVLEEYTRYDSSKSFN